MSEERLHEIERMAAEFVTQSWISREELCARLCIGPELLELCLEWDIIHPPRITPEGGTVFPSGTLDRLSSGLRLHRDLGIDWSGVCLALDLLERIEELESRLQTLSRHQTSFIEPGADHEP